MTLSMPDFSQLKLVIAGDVMLDRYWFGDVSRISPEAPVPIVDVSDLKECPGGAANVALNLRSLGCEVALFGVIGNDVPGQRLADLLEEAGVQKHLSVDADSPTIMKTRVIGQGHQMLRVDFEAPFVEKNNELMKGWSSACAHADGVIISDYAKGSLSCVLGDMIRQGRARAPVIVDPKSHDFTIYQGADVITPNLKEFIAAGGEAFDEHSIERSGQAMRKALGLKALLVTRGADGMSLLTDEGHLHECAHSPDVVDVTGAGDTVIAVFSAMLVGGAAMCDAMLAANRAAAVVVGHLGASTIRDARLLSSTDAR